MAQETITEYKSTEYQVEMTTCDDCGEQICTAEGEHVDDELIEEFGLPDDTPIPIVVNPTLTGTTMPIELGTLITQDLRSAWTKWHVTEAREDRGDAEKTIVPANQGWGSEAYVSVEDVQKTINHHTDTLPSFSIEGDIVKTLCDHCAPDYGVDPDRILGDDESHVVYGEIDDRSVSAPVASRNDVETSVAIQKSEAYRDRLSALGAVFLVTFFVSLVAIGAAIITLGLSPFYLAISPVFAALSYLCDPDEIDW